MDELAKNTLNEMLASATLCAKAYLKDQQSQHGQIWQDNLQDSVLENLKVTALILGHLMVGSYAAAHELLRQHLFSEQQVEHEIGRNASIANESRADDRRLRDA